MNNCNKCEIPIQEFLTGKHDVEEGVYCDECFFDELGEVIEKYPICVPHSVSFPADGKK
jgi:hypothetical protein